MYILEVNDISDFRMTILQNQFSSDSCPVISTVGTGLTYVVLVLLPLLHLVPQHGHQLLQLVPLHLHSPQLLSRVLPVWRRGLARGVSKRVSKRV
jgi:hypothetical protein